MADSTRLSTQACLSLAEVKQTLYRAGADGVFTCAEIDEVIEKLDYTYYLAEQADAINSMWEYGSKRGVEAMLNRPNTEKVVSIVEYRLRMEAKRNGQRDTAPLGDTPNDAA